MYSLSSLPSLPASSYILFLVYPISSFFLLLLLKTGCGSKDAPKSIYLGEAAMPPLFVRIICVVDIQLNITSRNLLLEVSYAWWLEWPMLDTPADIIYGGDELLAMIAQRFILLNISGYHEKRCGGRKSMGHMLSVGLPVPPMLPWLQRGQSDADDHAAYLQQKPWILVQRIVLQNLRTLTNCRRSRKTNPWAIILRFSSMSFRNHSRHGFEWSYPSSNAV